MIPEEIAQLLYARYKSEVEVPVTFEVWLVLHKYTIL